MIMSISNVQMSSGWTPSFRRTFSSTGELSPVLPPFSSRGDRLRRLLWVWRTYFPMTLSKYSKDKKLGDQFALLNDMLASWGTMWDILGHRDYRPPIYPSRMSQASNSFFAKGVRKNRQTWKPVSQRLMYLWAVINALMILAGSDVGL